MPRKMKKPHPCGCAEFEVLRVGVDFKLRCAGCGKPLELDLPDET